MPDITAITAPVSIPDFSEIKNAQEPLILKASQIVIRNVEQQGVALELLRDIRKNIATAKAKFKTIKDPMNVAKRAVDAWEHEIVDPWESTAERLSSANSAFITAQRQEAERETARLAKIERYRQQADSNARAKALADAGDIKGAVSVAVEADKAPAPYVAPVAPVVAKVVGIQSRTSYSCEVDDFKALVEYCLANPALIDLYLTPNTTALNSRARSSKEQFNIPGCKLITKYV